MRTPHGAPHHAAQRVDKPHPCHSEEYPKGTCFAARSDVGIRIFSDRNLRKAQNLCVLETDCRVAALLAMTARRCRADGTSGRRPLRVVQRTCPVGRDPCIPPFCSCHSEFVGADDSVRPHALAWESAFPKRGSGLPRRFAPRNDRLFRQSQRRGFAPPLLFCRSEQQKMQFMQEHPA